MKYFIPTLSLLLLSTQLSAQVNQGRIVYERTTQVQIRVNDPAFQNALPKERKDKFELLFADNKTLWRAADEESNEPEMNFDNGNGAQVRIVMPGANDVMYSDIAARRKVEQREVMSKQFTVEDSIRSYAWKIGAETRKILGYDCKMATCQRFQASQRVTMDNGQMNRVQVTDTLNIVAWFTDAIPVFAGPENYQGQLPGTILELDINNGRSHFIALSVSPKTDPREIKEPKGKKITQEEFVKQRDKLFQDMQQNGGGNVNIRVGN